jgi:hypothetical protein
MRQVTEELVPKRVITHVLDDRASIRKAVSTPQFIRGRSWVAGQQQRFNAYLPERFGAIWGLVFVFVAINEELTTRGYLLFTLTEGIGFWPAAIVLAALFAAGHLKNSGEQFIGIFAAGLIGVILAWTVRWTGSLWWAMGYHAAWDWAETYFYGVPDSGTVAPGHLFNSAARGPEWLSGGSVGPEGSIFVLPVVLLLIWVVRTLFPPTPPAGLKRLE